MEVNKIYNMDCLEGMKQMADNSVDSIVTDPPYGLKFMGKKWDYDVPGVEIWKECLRVLKPGGHLLSFAGTRTQHRMAVNIEDAGFEIRDMIVWVYGSGFPKSLNIGKAIDKLQGNEREVIPNPKAKQQTQSKDGIYGDYEATTHISKGSSEWEGWGTALKPALEPITVARKPLGKKTVASNVLKWGTGGINIDGSRVCIDKVVDASQLRTMNRGHRTTNTSGQTIHTNGRFPANFMHDGSEEVEELFPQTKPSKIGKPRGTFKKGMFANSKFNKVGREHNDKGSASRFFYCAKASKKDRGEDNKHPTVKPTKLIQYLVKLVTPPKGIVLDPFIGSGSTAKACVLEGFYYIGFEMDAEYCKIAEARVNPTKEQQTLHTFKKWKEVT